MGIVLANASIKGGVSKTATCLEVAAALSESGSRVLLIDLDPQCDLSEAAGVPIKAQYASEQQELELAKTEHRNPDPDKLRSIKTLLDAMNGSCPIAETITHTKWFDIIPGDPGLYLAEIQFTGTDDIYIIHDLCEVLKEYYDYILIDSHPSKNLLINMLYVAADYVIAPTLADDSSMEGIVSLERDLKELRDSRHHYSHAHILAVILARYKTNDSTCTRAVNSLTEILPLLGENTFFETVRESNRVSMARTYKQPIQEFEHYNNAAVDYRRIAKKIKEVCEHGNK